MTADPARVAFLADAYRTRARSKLAAMVVENRHRDFTIDECHLALAEVLTEARAQLVAAYERARLPHDRISARLAALLELSDEEIEELHRAGLLDDLELE